MTAPLIGTALVAGLPCWSCQLQGYGRIPRVAFARSVIRNTVAYQQPRASGLVQLTCSEAVSRLASQGSRSKESRGSPEFRLVAAVKEDSFTYKKPERNAGFPSPSKFMYAPVFPSSLTFSFHRTTAEKNTYSKFPSYSNTMAYASSANPQTVSAKKPKYDTTDMECCTYRLSV